MLLSKNFSFGKGFSTIEVVVLTVILFTIIGITVFFDTTKKNQAAVGKDVIRCIIDENASNLNSPACKRVISRCSNDTSGSCEKLIFYSDDGIHSDEALSILGNICSKGGEKACDILIKRCIENISNCEIFGKNYGIKNYLTMKAGNKNTNKTVMFKKLKDYYEKDVDNVVNSVIKTCISDKESMACEIVTSKVYEFSPSDKDYFILSQNSNSEIGFSKTGIILERYPKTELTSGKKNEDKSLNLTSDKNFTESADTENKDNTDDENNTINSAQINKPTGEVNNLNKDQNELPEKSVNSEASVDVSDKISDSPKEITGEDSKKVYSSVYKASLTTGEDNNIDYIRNKIYNFNAVCKELPNTKIKWLVSFDSRSTWKKWNGNSWVQIDTSSGIENIDFSLYGNNYSEIKKGLDNYSMQPGETSLDFAVELQSNDEVSTPFINKIEIKYY